MDGILFCRAILCREFYSDPLPCRYVATCMVPVEVKVRQAGGNLLGSKHQGHNVSTEIFLLLLFFLLQLLLEHLLLLLLLLFLLLLLSLHLIPSSG